MNTDTEEKKEAFKAHWDRPPISIDFDGPIHRYGKGWICKEIYDEPTEGVHFALQKLIKTHALHILSARPAVEILAWCELKFPDLKFALIPSDTHYWQVEGVIGITNTKLPAIAYIDDRGLRFTNWMDMRNYFQ